MDGTTLPPEMATDDDEWEGSIPLVKNADGGETIILTYSEYEEFENGMREELREGIQNMFSDPSFGVVSVETNDDFTNYIIAIEGERLNLAGTLGVYGLLVYSYTYSVFSGQEIEVVTFTLTDVGGNIISSFTSDEMRTQRQE